MYFFCNFNEIRGAYTSSFNGISSQNYIVMRVRVLMTFKVYTPSIINQPIRVAAILPSPNPVYSFSTREIH